MERWVAIQRNPVSGAGPDSEAIAELVRGLKARGLGARLFSNRDRLRRRLDDPTWREGLMCIVAAGGDGTVGDVVNRYPGRPVAILPLGTENLLARYLGVPRSGEAVAEMIASNRRRRLDVGRIGDRSFTLMASAGFDAEVVHRTHAGRSGHITRMRYIKPILQALLGYGFPPMRVFVDGSEDPIVARLVLVANVPSYARGLRVADSAVGDDGLLDLRLFERGSAFQMLRYIVKVLTVTHERAPDVRSVRASRVRIEADTPVPIQVDGDPAGRTPVRIEILPRALEVIVPGAGV